ncbi:1,4-dihydroxy-2-naphthoyl-CoA hydrolase [Dyadobacter sp. CECT 9623]|uniref:1,4-dihydroxy-2-naphthoyl-CoA hydrolase n=1 Tax=Dyadobacter linearis TaxID=2823330 RepID=A0ABM8UJT0_9BACT|nr:MULTISPECIES: thioesterase family protein [unclassified Dyadobacter]MCE7062088.1 acyl-CoA thioesterase [Dyadobacter sp. CY343]CAG5067668.1 1,4-dihydroxy-2-naphthoyl-CoA hydrolase [Dyadobacter sp. CECT 9623]
MIASEIEIDIRFSETDAMGVVWHGNYLKFFEDGREAFGKTFGLEYLKIFDHGYFTPIVKSEIDHKAPVYYGQAIKVITRYVPTKSAKIQFEYEVVNQTTGEVCAIGKTMQVFLDKETRTLELITPDFYREWKKRNQV